MAASARFVFREIQTGKVTSYEIGECANPRLFPEMWCDKRLCEGFWGDAEMAKSTTDAMNQAMPNALAQADAACGVSPGATGWPALVEKG